MWFRGTEAPSLRRRLLVLLLGAIVLVSTIQSAGAYRTALASADALFDSQLQQFAHSIGAGMPLAGDVRLFEFSIQVWGPDGVRLYRSQGLEVPETGIVGFSDRTVQGVRYRVYLLRAGDRSVQVAQNLDARRERARRLALDAVLPILLLAPLLMLAVWWIIARSLAPVERMRRQVADRAADDLSPLTEVGVPREVLPLVRELNLLFRRVDAAFASQKHFVADAAHELRSPLAALKLQVQSMAAMEPGPPHRAAVARLQEGVERAIQLLTQLLALARAESGTEGGGAPPLEDLQALCRVAVADVLPQAHGRNVDIGFTTPEVQATVQGEFESLRILLRNLLDNSVKFAAGRIDLSILTGVGGTTLRVEDDGPGVPEPERERVFDRFYRGENGARHAGSGLGLAIVRAIAQRHGARLRLDRSERLGGLLVDVIFPPPLSDA